MNNRAEAMPLSLSTQTLNGKTLKTKVLSALLLGSAFALGLSPAAHAGLGNTITVHVQNPSGTPVSGIGVCACHFGQNGPDSASQLLPTNGSGDAVFNVTGTQRFEILATAQNWLPTIHAQYTNPNHPWVYADDGGGALNATVIVSSTNAAGQPYNLGSVTANVSNATPSSVVLASIKLANGVSAGDGLDLTDGSGNASVTVNNVLFKDSNTYVLNVFDPAANKTVPVGVNQTLSVDQPSATYNVDFANGVTNSNVQQQQVSGGGNLSVTGVVVDSNSVPVPYTSIQFCQVNNNSGYNCNSQYWANTDGNGRFSVTGLSTGPYSVNINQSCNPNGLVCYQGYQNGSVASPNFTFTGALQNLTYTLQKMLPGTGVLNVVVTDSNGNPMPQSWVNLWPDWQNGTYHQASSGDPYFNTPGMNNVNISAPNGVAHITGLYPGNYILQVNNNFVATEDGSGVKFNYSAGGSTAQDGKYQNGSFDSTSYRLTINSDLGTDDVEIYDTSNPANRLDCNAPSGGNPFVDPYASHALCSLSGPTPVATSTVTVAIPTGSNASNNAVVRINYSFPAAEDLRGQPILISLQPDCSNNCQPGGGFTVLGGASQLGGTWPQSGHVDIPVQSGNTYHIDITADKWGWNRGEGDPSRVDLSGSTFAVVNMPFVPAGRIIGSLYTPTNTVFVPFQTNNGQMWANINAEGQGPGYGYAQVNTDGSYSIGGLVPGKYTMNAQVYVPSGIDVNYTSPFNLPVANVTANQDTYLDLHTVNAVAVTPQIDMSSVPPVTTQFCSGQSGDCRPETYIVKVVPQGTPLTSNATLRDFLNLTNGNGNVTEFGFTFSTNTQNWGRGCQMQNGVPNSFCTTNIPAPAVYDFYAIRADDFAMGVSTGPKPSFVILGSTKAFNVSPELATSGIPDSNNGQIVSSLNPLKCRQPTGPGTYGPEQSCTMKRTEALPIVAESVTRAQTTAQGAVSAALTNVFRQQDFDSWGGDFNNFMKYIPIVTLYDASGTLKAAGSILPNPGCLTDTLGQALQDSVAQGQYTVFQNTMKAWVACSAAKGIPLGFEIRGLPPQTKYNMVLTSPNYPPYQTTFTTGLDKSTVTVAAINLDGLGTGETLVVNVVDTTTMLGIPSAPLVLSGPAYAARTFNANSTGTIAIAGLAASGYTLSVQVPGYALASLNLPLVGTGKLTVNIGLTPASSEISGSVYIQTPSGNSLMPAADVYAYDDTLNAQHAGDPKFALPLYHTVTSTAGYYTFTGLLSGNTFKVSAKVPGYYVSGTTVATSGSPVTQDFTLAPKPLDIDVAGRPNGSAYTFTIKNPNDFADGHAWIQTDSTTFSPASPFYSTDTLHNLSVNFQKISDTQLQLNYPIIILPPAGYGLNLHIEAQSYGGDTVIKDLPFSRASLSTLQAIDGALVGDTSDSGSGTTLNQVLIDPTGTNPSALTIPPGSMIPVGDGVVPTASFNAQNPLDADEAGVFASTDAFVSNVYDLTLSSVNFTGTGFDLTVSYDPLNTNLNDLDLYVFINDLNGVTATALRPQSVHRPAAVGQWWSLKALGFPLTINAQNHTITVKGLKSLASVLSVKDSPMAAINTGRGFRPNTAYKSLGISPNEKSAFAVMKPSKQAKKPATAPGIKVPSVLGISSITWTWGTVAGAIEYRFYPSTGGNPITVPGASITLTGLNPSTAYGGKVSAMNNSGEGPLANVTTAYTLAAPVTNTAVDPATVFVSTALVTWDKGANGPTTKYKIEWYKAATPATIVSKISTIPYTTLTGLVSGTSYYVRVKAQNFNSKLSDADTAQPFYTLPVKIAAAPALTVSPALTTDPATLTVDQATWSWKAVANAQHYEIFDLGTSTITPASPTATTDDLFYTKTGLAANTTYSIRVRAVNDFTGAGPMSPALVVRSLNPTPTGTVATPAHLSLIVTWNANGAAAGTKWQVQYKKSSVTAWTSIVSTATSKVIPALLTGQAYDVRVRSLNTTLVPGVPDATSTATPTVVRTAAVAAAPEWKWEIPSGEIAKPNTVTAGTSAALAKVLAFPNPLLAGQPGINFVYVPEGATLKITNPAGQTVHTVTVKGGSTTWNGTTDVGGHKAPNGLYTATIESAGAQRAITLAVQR